MVKGIQSYVEPVELSSGFKYTTEIDKTSGDPFRKTVQSTFMYVAPRKTLSTLFANAEFEAVYVDYNKNHTCSKDVYERFCCGEVYQNNNFFRSNPLAIQVKTKEFTINVWFLTIKIEMHLFIFI